MFRALMVTYYVDNTVDPTSPGEPPTPRLFRRVNHFEPQALAGIVETLDLTYDLVGVVDNPVEVKSLPYPDAIAGPYNSNTIRKVNLRIGVRSEVVSKPAQDYIRNQVVTSVDVRSLASKDRYDRE